MGVQGLIGLQGIDGNQGVIGIQGTLGTQGIYGGQGIIGISVTGAQGVQGPLYDFWRTPWGNTSDSGLPNGMNDLTKQIWHESDIAVGTPITTPADLVLIGRGSGNDLIKHARGCSSP